MNLLDLNFEYDIKIDFEGDFDGGNYHVTLDYPIGTQQGITNGKTYLSLKQADIDFMYLGAKKLAEALKKHVSEYNL